MFALVIALAACALPRAMSQTITSTRSASASPTPYQVLPPPPTYANGQFLSPNTSGTQVFTEGSSIHISWTTTFQSVNLYFIYGSEYNAPITVSIANVDDYADYVLECYNNDCTKPYSFRAVDANGSEEEQKDGGFYTGQFWLSPTENSSSSSSSGTSSTPTQTTTTLAGASSTVPISITMSATSSSSPSPTPSPTHSPSSSAVAIGVGVGVGVGVAGLLIGAALTWWFLRKRRKSQTGPPAELSQPYQDNWKSPPQPPSAPLRSEMGSPEAGWGFSTPMELSSQNEVKPVEAPAWHIGKDSPRELNA